MFNTNPGGNYSKRRTAAVRKKTYKCCVVLSKRKIGLEGSHSREHTMQSDTTGTASSVSASMKSHGLKNKTMLAISLKGPEYQ